MISVLNKFYNKIINIFNNKTEVKKYCCICHSNVSEFSCYRGGWKAQPILMSILDIVGSDVDNFSCPLCGSHDRERHLYLYLEKLEIVNKLAGAKILHFAPEKRLSKIINEFKPLNYVKADLFPTELDIEKIDMTNIPYESETFDFVIANHVLEHIPDDFKALSELIRVLKSGGIVILQTPFSSKLKSTFEDSGIDNDLLRLQVYGQEDHVRLYGLDIFDRFTSVGFVADLKHHESTLSDIDPIYYGVNAQEPLFLFRKKSCVG
ncbi:class I SAM-dependent methyltransferase [Crenothrix polyspora]|uniref:Methyltransferase type 11 domain-containing protein n=1 Tax=Crenothrix polyspora TaxID=360316 RepID=A0A1R4H312_9GAMM|nr:class I SAM-dependent methyltransferase [Crenothrix polyspora]SJM90645.1 conserved hypothetical protein [Crenothrix polyspora]